MRARAAISIWFIAALYWRFNPQRWVELEKDRKIHQAHLKTTSLGEYRPRKFSMSDHSPSSEAHVTFEDDAGAYDQKAAARLIQLNALRMKLLAARDRRLES